MGASAAPQPFQYQGSKRLLAPRILDYLPVRMHRLVEPFAGSAALSLACARRARSDEYWLNDVNRPLTELLSLIVDRPEEMSDFYRSVWRGRAADHMRHYYSVRDQFNRTHDPRLLLYLLARCVKSSVRYNSDGDFNQSPDKRRLGTHPAKMRDNITSVSLLLRGRTTFTSVDFLGVLSSAGTGDVVYLDPPYQGVSGTRDHRYASGVTFDRFCSGLSGLNDRGIRFAVSYDGRVGDTPYGRLLPKSLNLVLMQIEAGRSSQATLLGRNAVTIESLYLSQPLAEEVGVDSGAFLARNPVDQLQLTEVIG